MIPRISTKKVIILLVVYSIAFNCFWQVRQATNGGVTDAWMNNNVPYSIDTDIRKNRGSAINNNNTYEINITHIPSLNNGLPKTGSEHAYAFVIGGIHEDRQAYKGFIYNIIITVNILRREGSTADFVLWAQLSSDSTLSQKLPDEDYRLLRALGVHVRILENEGYSSFAQIVYEKFRLFSMTEYKRVIFLDADIMPVRNMDYIFHLSNTGDPNPVLRPNLILATKGEPCNTAMFMVTPNETNWKTFQEVVKRQREEGKTLPYPHFDVIRGWGHDFRKAGAPWEAIVAKDFYKWDFHASHSDQGLMYYLMKFAIKDVSIVIGEKLQNWMPGNDEKARKSFDGTFLTEINDKGLSKLLPPPPPNYCNTKKFKCRDIPYMDFLHFSGEEKPWQNNFTKTGGASIWFDELAKLNTNLTMGLDIKNWNNVHLEHMKESPFGYLAEYRDHAHLVHITNKTYTTDPPTTKPPTTEPHTIA